MLNYDLTTEENLDLYRDIADEDELEELREFIEDPMPPSTNVIATLRNAAQRNLDNGDERYKEILAVLDC